MEAIGIEQPRLLTARVERETPTREATPTPASRDLIMAYSCRVEWGVHQTECETLAKISLGRQDGEARTPPDLLQPFLHSPLPNLDKKEKASILSLLATEYLVVLNPSIM